jgi:hypothetical protein
MTKKLENDQKKMNKLVAALKNTWGCEGKCKHCEFNITNWETLTLIKKREWSNYGGNCGAIMIRDLAVKLFSNSNTERVRKLIKRMF